MGTSELLPQSHSIREGTLAAEQTSVEEHEISEETALYIHGGSILAFLPSIDHIEIPIPLGQGEFGGNLLATHLRTSPLEDIHINLGVEQLPDRKIIEDKITFVVVPSFDGILAQYDSFDFEENYPGHGEKVKQLIHPLLDHVQMPLITDGFVEHDSNRSVSGVSLLPTRSELRDKLKSLAETHPMYAAAYETMEHNRIKKNKLSFVHPKIQQIARRIKNDAVSELLDESYAIYEELNKREPVIDASGNLGWTEAYGTLPLEDKLLLVERVDNLVIKAVKTILKMEEKPQETPAA